MSVSWEGSSREESREEEQARKEGCWETSQLAGILEKVVDLSRKGRVVSPGQKDFSDNL